MRASSCGFLFNQRITELPGGILEVDDENPCGKRRHVLALDVARVTLLDVTQNMLNTASKKKPHSG